MPKGFKKSNEGGKREIEMDRAEAGNTKPLQPPQLKHHCFTWNNYHLLNDRDYRDINIKTLQRCLDELCFAYCFQEETGAEGTRHLQGVISLHKRARWGEFGLPHCIHWEGCGHVPRAYEYCSKLETRTGEIFSKNYEPPVPLPTLWKGWQFVVDSICQTKADDRTVNWIWSKHGGIGKSYMAKYLILKYNATLCVTGKYADICNLIYKQSTNVVVFDLPRNSGGGISYSAVESIKNGMVSNTKYETGFKVFRPPHVFIFSNDPPDVHKLSGDRWHIINIDLVSSLIDRLME